MEWNPSITRIRFSSGYEKVLHDSSLSLVVENIFSKSMSKAETRPCR